MSSLIESFLYLSRLFFVFNIIRDFFFKAFNLTSISREFFLQSQAPLSPEQLLGLSADHQSISRTISNGRGLPRSYNKIPMAITTAICDIHVYPDTATADTYYVETFVYWYSSTLTVRNPRFSLTAKTCHSESFRPFF